MIETIKKIQRERADGYVTEMFFSDAIEHGQIADLMLEGAMESEEEIFGDEDTEVIPDKKMDDLIEKIPEFDEIKDNEMLDKYLESTGNVTLGDILPETIF